MKNWITTFSKSYSMHFFLFGNLSICTPSMCRLCKDCCCPLAIPLKDIQLGIQIFTYLSDKAITKDVSSKLIKAPLKSSHQERGQQNLKEQKFNL